MADASLLSAMFSFVSVFYGIMIPLLILQSLALLFIPSMMKNGAQPRKVGEAIFCYLMQAVGVLLMTTGALPTVVSVLAGVELAGTTYFTLLLIFAAGGILFLWHDSAVRTVDEASRAVPAAIFRYMFKLIGYVLILLWVLSLLVSLMNGTAGDPGWWIMPIVMILYGLILAWCTRSDIGSSNQSVFQSIAVNPPSSKPSKKSAPKPAAKRAAPKRRKR